MHRKDFIRSGFLLCTPYVLRLAKTVLAKSTEDYIMTVNGHIPSADAGFTLTHEHILVDFIGADKIATSRYNAKEYTIRRCLFCRRPYRMVAKHW